MSEGKGGDRVRVAIAGNIYAKRALVKRFLEDDGFRVVAEAETRPELSAALETSDPDAVVVDADLLAADEAAIAAIRRKAPGKEHPDGAAGLDQLGWLLKEKGDYNGAEPLLREALDMRRGLLGEEHLDVATSLDHLALMQHAKGNGAEAGPLFREALAALVFPGLESFGVDCRSSKEPYSVSG